MPNFDQSKNNEFSTAVISSKLNHKFTTLVLVLDINPSINGWIYICTNNVLKMV